MFDAAFRLGGYSTSRQTLLERDGVRTAVSLKWQQGKGSAEDKVPWEVICLVKAIREGAVERAYIVIGGNGWRAKRKAFYTSGGLTACISGCERVTVCGFEDFVALANNGRL